MAGADSAEFSETALSASVSGRVRAWSVDVKKSRKSSRKELENLGLIAASE
jgi:hypothetical protein